MPLSENIERAKIARHVCALANSGGGWLIFGFENNGAAAEPYPDNLSAYDQDAINGIVARYLDPEPHCETHYVTANSGKIYPIIRIPSHGSVPICAKSDGPHEKGVPQGIRKGFHYIRVSGPKSVPIDSPELWRELLHRCVLSERAGLLSSIAQLFDRPQVADEPGAVQRAVDHVLDIWATIETDWPVSIVENRVAFGFRLLDDAGNPPPSLPLSKLNELIREASFSSADVVRDGGASFEAGWDNDSRARVTLVEDREGYYAQQTSSSYNLPAYWFVRDDGVGVEVTAIAEDSRWTREAVEGRGRTRAWPHGKRLAPTFQIDMIAQRIAFVGKLAEGYPAAVNCELVVDYVGLEGREIDDPRPGSYFSMNRSCNVNGRRVPIIVSVSSLVAEISEVTASLIGPIFRLFEGWDVGPDYVRSWLERR